MTSSETLPPARLTLGDGDSYKTAPRKTSWLCRTFPTPNFYRQFWWNVYCSSLKAKRGKYDDQEWSESSHRVLDSLESVGVKIEISGRDHIRSLNTPCVFVGNHMSMLETIILPCVIRPIRRVTFVVKQSLMEYPVFRHIVGSRNPIAVSRDNPREDLKTVMQGGIERLANGTSIVVFPQTTRADHFDPSTFNSIGIKLALRAKVPVVPVALVTNAWGNGKWVKDLGPISPDKTVRFAFGPPIQVTDRGTEQQQQVVDFIQKQLGEWGVRTESR